jgi:hypothetical protein
MKKNISIAAGIAALLFAAVGIVRYANSSMEPADVVRKLSGMRMAVTMFRLARGRQPADIREVIENGNLEAVPVLKLTRHPASSKVRNTPELAAQDTGGWAYVNDPKSREFGTVFIDCTHKDGKGRFWSEF